MDYLIQYLSAKDWSIYPFIPPLFSIFANFFINPVYGKHHEEILRSYLNSEGLGEKFVIINSISKDRGLQIAYLSSIPAFIASLLATLRSQRPGLLTAAVIVTFMMVFPLYLRIFLKPPGYHASTRFPPKAKPAFLFARGWTYFDIYSNLLFIFNLVLIIIIIIALPSKQP